MRWDRQEYMDLVTFQGAKRPMFVEIFGPLIGLAEEWAIQGATPEEISLQAFAYDYVDKVSAGCNLGLLGGFEEKILEDNTEYRISTDSYGRTVKLCKDSATIPLPMDYPVKNMDDWLKMKPMFAYHPARFDLEAALAAKAAQDKGALVLADMPGGFDMPRELMGEEELCVAYYDQPELIEDMLQTFGDTAERVLEQTLKVVTIDNLCVHEDMAGKSGPLIGPNLYDQYVTPYYRRVWEIAKAGGARVFSQDSDGNMNPLMENIIASGVNLMYPMEPGSGMDIVECRRKYGNRVAYKAGIDKYTLRGSKEDIRKEIEYKVGSLKNEQGIIFGLDHRIPNGVTIENYRYYIALVKQILGIDPMEPGKWVRMGF